RCAWTRAEINSQPLPVAQSLVAPVSARDPLRSGLLSSKRVCHGFNAGAEKIGEEFVSRTLAIIAALLIVGSQPASAQDGQKWVAAWAASAQGPYPIGNPSAQPDQRFALPSPEAGARDQTTRLVVRACVWGGAASIRSSDVYGTR